MNTKKEDMRDQLDEATRLGWDVVRKNPYPDHSELYEKWLMGVIESARNMLKLKKESLNLPGTGDTKHTWRSVWDSMSALYPEEVEIARKIKTNQVDFLGSILITCSLENKNSNNNEHVKYLREAYTELKNKGYLDLDRETII